MHYAQHRRALKLAGHQQKWYSFVLHRTFPYFLSFNAVYCTQQWKISSTNRNTSFKRPLTLFQPNPHYKLLLYLRCILNIKLSINNLLVRGKSRQCIYRKLIEENALSLTFRRERWTNQVGRIWEHAPFCLKRTCILLPTLKQRQQQILHCVTRNTRYLLISCFKNLSHLEQISRNCLKELWLCTSFSSFQDKTIKILYTLKFHISYLLCLCLKVNFYLLPFILILQKLHNTRVFISRKNNTTMEHVSYVKHSTMM